ncbi:MAG: homocysteine S-methyltransferase family protein [Chthoniobacterales bacterium]
MADFLDHLTTEVLVADSGIGESLSHHGPAEHLCLLDPDRVREAHQLSIEGGAAVIRTNSFRANAAFLAANDLGRHVSEINWSASQIARQAIAGTNVFVAARVGPLPSGVPPNDRADLFRQQIGALLDGRAQLVCLEGFTDVQELITAIEIKHELHHCPVIATLATTADLEDHFARLLSAEADVVGLSSLPAEQIANALAPLDLDATVAAFPAAEILSPDDRTRLTDAGCSLIGINPPPVAAS